MLKKCRCQWILLLALLSPLTLAGGQPSQKAGASVHLLSSELTLPRNEPQVSAIAFKVPAATGLLEIQIQHVQGAEILQPDQQWRFVGQKLQPVIQLPVTLNENAAKITFLVRAWENTDADMSEADIRAQISPVGKILTLTVRDSAAAKAAQQNSAKPQPTSIKTLPDGSKRHLLPAQVPPKSAGD